MKIVIIGGGAAGTATATRLRRLNENDEILILEKSNELAVSNCGLAYYLSGVVEDKHQLIGTTAEKMKQKYNIDVRLNAEAEAINREEKTVTLVNREEISYDKLVIAIGAYQMRPDIEGVLGEQIFTIKDIASIDKIKEYIKYNDVKNAVIMGGGFVGVEAAQSLTHLGIHTSLVEYSSHILPSFDEDMAATLHNHMRDQGVNLYLNQSVTAFGEKTVTLSTGRTIPYDMAILATGVRPDLKLTVMADLEIGETGGLKVNSYMQTSDKDIYAAGDDVEIIDLITGKPTRMAQAGLAVKQAKIIADHIEGLSNELRPALGTSITEIFDYTAAAIGANEKKLKENNIKYFKLNLYDSDHAGYMPNNSKILIKLLFDRVGKILGAQIIGKGNVDKRINILSLAAQNNMDARKLELEEFAYAPPYSAGKDAINNLGSMVDNILSGRVKMISDDEVDWSNITNETMLIDIRNSEDFLEGKIPNAINIPITALRNNLDSIPHDKKVILYCRYGVGSYIASRILTNRGFDNIYVLNGGMELYNQIVLNNKINDSQKDLGRKAV